MKLEDKEHFRCIQYLTGLANDYLGSCRRDDVGDLNRRLGYCEAILDLISDFPKEEE